MPSDDNTDSFAMRGPSQSDRNNLRLSVYDPVGRFVLVVGLAGLVSFTTLLVVQGAEPWPVLPWLALTVACALTVGFPYRVNRAGESFYIDFDEIILVLSLPYLGAAASVAVLVVGYLLGATARGTGGVRMLFNAGSRATAVTAALSLATLTPLTAVAPWDYILTGLLAAVVYSLINQILVSNVLAMFAGTSFRSEFVGAVTQELMQSWPVVVSYGLLVGVASFSEPLVLVLAAIPVALLIASSRRTQIRREEHERMRGLYVAAQEIHDARSDTDVLRVLRSTVKSTLGIESTELRSTPPMGEELGAWLPNRHSWLIVANPVSPETRRQDDAFLQALASLVDAGMERATMVTELERQSLRDPLTNAYNRRYFHQALAKVLERAEAVPGCLALLDVDHFKAINDEFGHDVGDHALKELVRVAGETFRSDDILCRIGGDEFALILPGVAPELAVERLELLRRRIAEQRPGEPESGPVSFRTSVGVAAFPRHGRESAELIRAADQALYQAKRGGRDQVVVWGNRTVPGLGVD